MSRCLEKGRRDGGDEKEDSVGGGGAFVWVRHAMIRGLSDKHAGNFGLEICTQQYCLYCTGTTKFAEDKEKLRKLLYCTVL